MSLYFSVSLCISVPLEPFIFLSFYSSISLSLSLSIPLPLYYVIPLYLFSLNSSLSLSLFPFIHMSLNLSTENNKRNINTSARQLSSRSMHNAAMHVLIYLCIAVQKLLKTILHLQYITEWHLFHLRAFETKILQGHIFGSCSVYLNLCIERKFNFSLQVSGYIFKMHFFFIFF